MSINAATCRALRARFDWSRQELAQRAGLGERTITDFERGARTPHANNLLAIKTAFETAGARFEDDGFVCFPTDSARG